MIIPHKGAIPGGDILFQDDFNRADSASLGPLWSPVTLETYTASASIVSNTATVFWDDALPARNVRMIRIVENLPANIIATFTVTKGSSTGYERPYFVFRYLNPINFWVMFVGYNSGGNSSYFIFLMKYQSGSFNAVPGCAITIPEPFPLAGNYKLETKGNNIKCYKHGDHVTPVINYTDSFANNGQVCGIANGQVGSAASGWTNECKWDNIIIRRN